MVSLDSAGAGWMTTAPRQDFLLWNGTDIFAAAGSLSLLRSISNAMLSELSLKKLKEISDDAAYLIAEPPKKRIIDANGNLDWRNVPVTTTKDVIHACRRLRNNLFHGNKYAQEEPRDDNKSADQQRNIKLLRGALDILGEFLNLGAGVRKFYDDASL